MNDLVDCLEHWAVTQPDKVLYRFVDGRGNVREHYTYLQFCERASGLALQFAGEGIRSGDRVLLVYPPGLEMLAAFFGVLNIGAIPVPVCAPLSLASGAGAARIEHVARDCDARHALTTDSYLRSISSGFAAGHNGSQSHAYLSSLNWMATDRLVVSGERLRERQRSPVLFLQYTSGSTGDPKGVVVTHRNVIHNANETTTHCPIGVSWLPQYHDMGLIGHYLFVVVKGGTNYGFAPFDFLKRPTLWLHMISRVKATMTTAPNFAYSYCLREDKVPDDALTGVDLSSLKGMLNAAEPIHPDTYERFYERFARYGLKREAFYGGYGLAESTLAVSLHGRQTLVVQKHRMQRRQLAIQKSSGRNNNQITLVSCGRPFSSLDVRIVEPETRVGLGENAIGEIWIDGESKCDGYWQRDELTQTTFHARIADQPENSRSYLRTGDLGFLHEGELYICGRIKDMIIIHGANYYPQDIETIVETEFPNLTPEGGVRSAAFAVTHEGEERLVVAIEVGSQHSLVPPAAVAQAIRSKYFIEPYQIHFVPPRTISKTTSGKVSRSKTRDRFLQGSLPILVSYTQESGAHQTGTGLRGILNRIKELYNLHGDEEITLTEIGLDSLTLVDLTLEIQTHFESRGMGELVSELDARFLQRLRISELSRLLGTYETSENLSTTELRTWLESRQQFDDAEERRQMRADAKWSPPSESAEDATGDPRAILMTGGSGFFGPFLLSSLLQRTPCAVEVLVRAADPIHGKARLEESLRRADLWTSEIDAEFQTRVSVVCGDLGLPQLGVSDKDWRRLESGVDAIVHNGARVNYVLSYAALRATNVESTRELLRLAATRRNKQFHLISSTFVHGWSARPVAAEHDYNEDLEELDFGYSQSKCVAEHLVLDAHRQGMPVRIYRPTLISASSRGVGSTDDILVRMLAFMIKHGLGVETLNQTSILPADVVSDHIARIFLLNEVTSPVFQITTSQYYNMMDITRIISDQFGYSFDYRSMPQLIEDMNRLCTPDDLLYPLRVFFNRSYDKFKPMEPKRYDNRHYRAALARVEPDVVEPDPSETISYIMKHMQREGLIPAHCFA